jgi:hypothetical protein
MDATELSQNAWVQEANEMTQNTRQVLEAMKGNMASTMSTISSPGTGINKFLTRMRKKCSPPGSASGPLTFGEILHGLDRIKVDRDWAKLQARVPKMSLAELEHEFDGLYGVAALFEEAATEVSWRERFVAAAKETGSNFKKQVLSFGKWWRLLKGIVHGAAVGLLAVGLITSGSTMNKVNVWMSSLQIASYGVEWLGKAGRWLFTKLYAMWEWGSRMSGRLVTWLSNYALESGASLGRR